MFGSGRTAGIFVTIGGCSVACGGSTVFALAKFNTNMNVGWTISGIILSVVVASPLVIFGTRLFQRGQRELKRLKMIKKQKKLLCILKAQGFAQIDELTKTLQTDPADVRRLIYDLVQQNLFHGYVNWEDGMLYPKPAVELQRATHCPQCGVEKNFKRNGVVQCQTCKAQIFL